MDAYIDSDNTLWLRGAQTTQLTTGAQVYLDGSATVTFRIQTDEHVDLPGYPWPETMLYIAGSQGDFLGVLRDTLPWEANHVYRLITTVDAGPDQKRTWDLPLRVMVSQS